MVFAVMQFARKCKTKCDSSVTALFQHYQSVISFFHHEVAENRALLGYAVNSGNYPYLPRNNPEEYSSSLS